jgi:mannose-6-phosphate isomerase-like protein (cupin superfamily)
MIYCYRGWVKVVYEDQGPPFVMRAGDCVLQPPHIRHRVLECSDAFEVVEIGCPAEHETLVDHDMSLPNSNVDHDREYSGQAFVFHEEAKADWTARRSDGFEVRDTGIGQATRGEASVVVVRCTDPYLPAPILHDAELLFRFVLEGSVVLRCSGDDEFRLDAGDAFVVPAGMQHQLDDPSAQLQMLEVALPADFSRSAVSESRSQR